jgi:hypothetical protein
MAEAQASRQYSEQPLPSSPSIPSGAGDMTYATVNSEDQPAAKGKGKAPVVKKTAAGVAAAKKQALSKKKQREVGCLSQDLA